MIIIGEAVDRSGLTVKADIILTAFLAFFRHTHAAETPYGPLLGHAWVRETKFYVPDGSTFPCPCAKSPVTKWTVIVGDSMAGCQRVLGSLPLSVAISMRASSARGAAPGTRRVRCFRGVGRAVDSPNARGEA